MFLGGVEANRFALSLLQRVKYAWVQKFSIEIALRTSFYYFWTRNFHYFFPDLTPLRNCYVY